MIFLCGYKQCRDLHKFTSLYDLMEHYVNTHRWGKHGETYRIVSRLMQQSHERGL